MSTSPDPNLSTEPAGLLPPPTDSSALDGAGSIVNQRPELAAAGAFAGGLAVALILKRLGN